MHYQITVIDKSKKILWETSVEADSEEAAQRVATRTVAERFPNRPEDEYDVVLSRPV
jgi:hypothetical protein